MNKQPQMWKEDSSDCVLCASALCVEKVSTVKEIEVFTCLSIQAFIGLAAMCAAKVSMKGTPMTDTVRSIDYNNITFIMRLRLSRIYVTPTVSV